MLKRYQHIVGGVFRLIDALVIVIAWIAAYWLRFHFPIIEVTKGFPHFSQYAALSPLVLGLWMGVFSWMRVYQSRRMLRRTHEAHLLLRAHAVALLVFVALTYLFSEYRYSRGVMIEFGLIGAVLLVSFRLALRNALRAIRRRGINLRHVLIVGEGPVVQTLTHRLGKFPELGLRVVGQVTQKDFGQLQQRISQSGADQILIALPRSQYPELDRVLGFLKDETIEIQLVPDLHEYMTLGCEVEDFDGVPIVNLNDSPLYGWGAALKRLTDFAFSLVALILFSPILLLIALAVKITSKGPIFYAQERMGLDGRTFRMLKFRSMRMDAESATGAVWAQQGDQRRTPIGTFLRSTSLDELPQLWNVLRGDMSLVGPRPERPVFVHQFRHEIPHYMLRHKVKAGITGWAQVNGWRGNTSLSRRIECDLYYIRNWSYSLDLKILFLTVWKGFINKNAY